MIKIMEYLKKHAVPIVCGLAVAFMIYSAGVCQGYRTGFNKAFTEIGKLIEQDGRRSK